MNKGRSHSLGEPIRNLSNQTLARKKKEEKKKKKKKKKKIFFFFFFNPKKTKKKHKKKKPKGQKKNTPPNKPKNGLKQPSFDLNHLPQKQFQTLRTLKNRQKWRKTGAFSAESGESCGELSE
jgi:hypothetical protein